MLPKLAGGNLDLELRKKKLGGSPVPHLRDRDNTMTEILLILFALKGGYFSIVLYDTKKTHV